MQAIWGIEAMRAARAAAGEAAQASGMEPPKILAVTILTSIDQRTMNEQMRIPGGVEDQVVHLASLAVQAGLDGVVASPHEIAAIRAVVSKDVLVVCPGVRPSWAATQDQRRVMTPAAAVQRGASFLVIGRPIIRPPAGIGTAVDAALLIAEEIDSVR